MIEVAIGLLGVQVVGLVWLVVRVEEVLGVLGASRRPTQSERAEEACTPVAAGGMEGHVFRVCPLEVGESDQERDTARR